MCDAQQQVMFYPSRSQTLRGAGLLPHSKVRTAFLTATHQQYTVCFKQVYKCMFVNVPNYFKKSEQLNEKTCN